MIEGAPALATLVSNADQRLFNSISANLCHLLQRQLPVVKNTGFNIRPRAHVASVTGQNIPPAAV